jgi:hypothetical protein
VWNYTGTDWVKTQGTDAVSGAVLDNTVANPASITTPGRYIVPATGTAGSFVGQESKFADYDGVSFTFSTPTDLIKIVITTGVNVGQTWQYTAANPTKWAQVVSSAISIYPWVLSSAYTAGTVVNYQGNLYQANGTITANTAFTVGTTGATWAAYLKIDDKFAVPTTPATVASGQSVQTAIANLQGQILNMPIAPTINSAVTKIQYGVTGYAYNGSFTVGFYSGTNGTGTLLYSFNLPINGNGTFWVTVPTGTPVQNWASVKISNNYSWFVSPPTSIQFYNAQDQPVLTNAVTGVSGYGNSVKTGNYPTNTLSVTFN